MVMNLSARYGDGDTRDQHTVAVAKYSIYSVDHGSRTPEFGKHSSGRPVESQGKYNDRKPDQGMGLRDLAIWCGIPVIIVLLLRIFLFGVYSIPSGSMLDTINEGDRVITTKLAPKYKSLNHGDIIVFKDPANWLKNEGGIKQGDDLIKRLIGLPGDHVACQGAGKPVTINGVAIDETSYIRPGVDPSAFAFDVTVSEGHVFVLGDNRASSADSRYHQDDGANGQVPVDDVVGVALITYWPLNRIGKLDSHHEVFADVPDSSSNA